MSTAKHSEAWARLVEGKDLSGLDLPLNEGRIDLRGLVLPNPSVGPAVSVGPTHVEKLQGVVLLRGVHWKDLDLAKARLPSLRFFDSRIENCVFDNAACRDWRMWGTTVADTTFRKASLRGAALGGVDGKKRNAFRRVDFTHTDLRGTAWGSSEMVECTFKDAKLSKVDFQGTVFVNCTFEGELEEVLFYRQGFNEKEFPPNEMKDVDFRRARFHFVEFRNLDLEDVRWPEGDDHIVVDDFIPTIKHAHAQLAGRGDPGSKGMTAMLAMKLKWAGAHQRRGVLSISDFMEVAGPEGVRELRRLLAQGRG